MDKIETIINYLSTNIFHLGPLAGFLLCYLESLIPILPLAVFIALNIKAFGVVLGFLISYIATVLGSLTSYFLFKRISKTLVKKRKSLEEKINIVSNMDFATFTVLSSLPFAPTFMFNVIAGLSDMKLKKFFFSLLLSRITIVVFWGFIGKSFIESIHDLKVIVFLIVFLIINYLLSKLIVKKFNLK